ncbi:MAG: hypothetical protein R3C11_27060 [Planctomycetaceae bacterium]
MRQQREVDTMDMVAPMARKSGSMLVDSDQSVGISRLSKVYLAGRVRDNLNDEHLVRWAIRA